MEQELAEAAKQREEERRQWAERAGRADAEVAALRSSLEELRSEVERQESALREAEHASQEALEKEKMEVARLESELALMREAELAASESNRAEIEQLESELASLREAASQDAAEREKFDKLEREQEDAQKKEEILAEVWRHLRPLAAEEATAEEEEVPFPADLSLFLDTVQSIETQLTRLKDERSEKEEHCAELTHTMTALQGENVYLVLSVYEHHCFHFITMF